jgi:hypothetical protein
MAQMFEHERGAEMMFKELPLGKNEYNCPRCPGVLLPIAFVKWHQCAMCARRFIKKGRVNEKN